LKKDAIKQFKASGKFKNALRAFLPSGQAFFLFMAFFYNIRFKKCPQVANQKKVCLRKLDRSGQQKLRGSAIFKGEGQHLEMLEKLVPDEQRFSCPTVLLLAIVEHVFCTWNKTMPFAIVFAFQKVNTREDGDKGV